MGSSRLPGKSLMLLAGRPALGHVIDRAGRAKLIDDIWVATTTDKKDDKLARFAGSCKARVFRGNEDDVLDRFYQAAKSAKAKAGNIIVRLTGDCPLLDPKLIDEVIRYIKRGKYDFATNCCPPSLPDGFDVEAVTFAALERVWISAKLASEREHAFSFIVRNPDLFKIGRIIKKPDLSAYRLTLDYPADLRFLNLLMKEEKKYGKGFGLKKIINILKKHSDWLEIISGKVRNENYFKSLKDDRIVK